jgi:hypothetical protein
VDSHEQLSRVTKTKFAATVMFFGVLSRAALVQKACARFRSLLERVLAAEGGYFNYIASPYLQYIKFLLINLYYNYTKCLFF